MNRQDKSKIVIQVSLCLIIWFGLMKLSAYGIDRIGQNWPEVLRLILTTMIIPYGLFMPIIIIFLKRVDRVDKNNQSSLDLNDWVKLMIVQTGLSMFVMTLVNILLTIAGVRIENNFIDRVNQHFVFYFILLILFNPLAEEYFFRRVLLNPLRRVGEKEGIIISACLFALPHAFSQGIGQMFSTFVLGIIWAWLMVKTNKLRYPVLLHSFANLYGMYIPMFLTKTTVGMVLFMAMNILILPVLSLILIRREMKIIRRSEG
ncbi:MAG: CPBP family intramembrane metalloprotease [Gallicola sp.]|nr:CPBP family intramembrane metalloprotease [Gallicola sp.]